MQNNIIFCVTRDVFWRTSPCELKFLIFYRITKHQYFNPLHNRLCRGLKKTFFNIDNHFHLAYCALKSYRKGGTPWLKKQNKQVE